MIRAKYLQRALTIAVAFAMCAGVMAIAYAEHGDRTLDVNPETTRVPVGTKVILIAQLSSPVTATEHPQGIEIDAEAVPVPGAVPVDTTESDNDPDGTDGDSPETADETCFIPAGEYRCAIEYVAANEGTDQWRFWIDENHQDEAADDEDHEADTSEGLNDGNQLTAGEGDACNSPGPDDSSGVSGEPDCTDVVQVTIGAASTQATTLDCDDQAPANGDTEENTAGQTETYTCKLRKQDGTNGIGTVYGEVETTSNDPDMRETDVNWKYNVPDYVCVTGTSGQDCTITATQADNEIGKSEICFWTFGTRTDQDQGGDIGLCGGEETNESLNVGQATDQGNDLANQAEKTWTSATTGATTTGTTTRSASGTSTASSTATGSTTRPSSTTSTTSSSSSSTATTPSDERVASNVSIDYRRGAFKGKVGSSNKRCKSSRAIKLKKKKPGRDRTVGRDNTNRRGKWSIRKRARRGSFYAVAAKKVFTARDGHRVVCGRDKSPTEKR